MVKPYEIKSSSIKIPQKYSKNQIKLMQIFSNFYENMKAKINENWV